MRLKGRWVPVATLTTAQRQRMFELMERYYENVTQAQFLTDLAEKHWVILLLNPSSGEVCGFSTQVLLEVTVGDRSVKALFSGDTIIDEDHRGDIALAHVWGQLAQSLMERYGSDDLYWFLISKGYKTYRFLPLFFREFYPRHDAPTPDWARRLIDALGRHKFGPAYDAAAGVVRAGATKDRLRPGVADLTPQRLRDPDVACFAQHNPGHARGDELCCLAPLTPANWTRAGQRALAAGPAPAET